MNRKGIFLSITALMIIGFMFVSMNSQVSRDSSRTTIVRLEEVSRQIAAIDEKAVPSIIRTHARQVINDLAIKIVNGERLYTSIEDFEFDFNYCMVAETNAETIYDLCEYQLGGYVNEYVNRCKPEDYCDKMLLQASLSEEMLVSLQEKLDSLAEKIVEYQQYETVSISVDNFKLETLGSFNLGVTANISLLMEEPTSNLKIDKNEEVLVSVPVIGLVDPYATELLGNNDVIWRVNAPFVDSGPNAEVLENIYDLEKVVLGSHYKPDPDGRTYLDRLLTIPTIPGPDSDFGLHVLTFRDSKIETSVDWQDVEEYMDECLYSVYYSGHGWVNLPPKQAGEYNILLDELIDSGYVGETNC